MATDSDSDSDKLIIMSVKGKARNLLYVLLLFLLTPPKKNSAYPTTPSAFAVKKFMQTDQKRPGPLANAARN